MKMAKITINATDGYDSKSFKPDFMRVLLKLRQFWISFYM